MTIPLHPQQFKSMFTYNQVKQFLAELVKRYLLTPSLISSNMNTLNIFGDCYIPQYYSASGKPQYLPKHVVANRVVQYSKAC
jgi:hypothetical protein